MFDSYLSYSYFFDLAALLLLLVPALALLPAAAHRPLLTLAGMYLVYFIAPRLLAAMLLFWSVVYLLQRPKELKGRTGTIIATLSFALVFAPMALWKVYGDAFNTVFNGGMNDLLKHFSFSLWQIDRSFQLVAPVGLSFATFRALDLLIKRAIGLLEPLSFADLMFYGFFPPVQVVGPIIEYKEIANKNACPTPDDILAGLTRMAVGAIKIFFITEALSPALAVLENPQSLGWLALWGKFILYTFRFYIDFSGYSDIAIGAARALGYKIRENFDFPFFKRNIQEFWNSWHMSLSSWAQRNIFVPMGGYRAHTQHIALFLTIMFIALWHNFTWPVIAFGIYHFALLSLHRAYKGYVAMQHIADTPQRRVFYTILTYFSSIISFPLITTSWDKAAPLYRALLGW